MPRKSMGSGSVYITPKEASKILGVSSYQVQAWSTSGLLEPHYPDGPRPHRLSGKRFLRTDVLSLYEAREQLRGARTQGYPKLALKAFVASRRVEKKLDELMRYLGLTTKALELDKEHILAFVLAADRVSAHPETVPEDEICEWAQKLLAVTEEYLELAKQATGNEDVWEVFLAAGRALATVCSPGTTARMFVDHARAHLRNTSYLYLRGVVGARAANKVFPGEGYTSSLVRTIYPSTH